MAQSSKTVGIALVGVLVSGLGCSKCGSSKTSDVGSANPEASKIVAPPAPGTPAAHAAAGPLLDVTTILSAEDLPASMKKGPPVSSERIQGVAQSPGYDSRRYFVPGSGDLGVGIQWWHYNTNSEAVIRYMKDLHSYAQASAKEEVATHSFQSVGYHSIVLVYFDDPKKSVVALTCGSMACGFSADAGATPDAWAMLVDLAKKVDGHLPN